MASLVRDTAARRRAREIHLVLLGRHLRSGPHRLLASPRRPARPAALGRHARSAHRPQRRRRPASSGSSPSVLDGILADPTTQALARALARSPTRDRPLRVTYVVGNHDRVLWNFPAAARPASRAAIPGIDRFVPALESPDYAVLARHGHEWDDHCHGWRFRDRVLRPGEPVGRFAPEAYEVMAIGEVITAELMGGLVHHVRDGGGPEWLVEQVKDVNNLRPILDVFAWLEWLGEGRPRRTSSCSTRRCRSSLEAVLDVPACAPVGPARARPPRLRRPGGPAPAGPARADGVDFRSFKGRVEAREADPGASSRECSARTTDRLLKGAGGGGGAAAGRTRREASSGWSTGTPTGRCIATSAPSGTAAPGCT